LLTFYFDTYLLIHIAQNQKFLRNYYPFAVADVPELNGNHVKTKLQQKVLQISHIKPYPSRMKIAKTEFQFVKNPTTEFQYCRQSIAPAIHPKKIWRQH
jgi:hypothetical protein